MQIITIINNLIYKQQKDKNKQMSVQITFTNIQISYQILTQNLQSHQFQLQIISKQYKENMKKNIDTIKKGLIDLPQNIFILPYNGVINVRIEQKNDEKLINKVLQLGEYKFILNQLTISKIKQKQIQQGFIQFFTFSKNFIIKINYKAIIKSHTIFAGHFHGILKNQGISTLTILNIQKYHQQTTKSKLQIENHDKQPQNLNKKQKEKDLKPLYLGACQSKNLFSCFDQHVEQQQICIIEPIYRK